MRRRVIGSSETGSAHRDGCGGCRISSGQLDGLNAATSDSCVSIRPAPIRSRQYGTAGKTAARQTSIDRGFPGRLMMSVFPRIPAIWRESMAVGTVSRLTRRINSPKPGSSLPTTEDVASGVRSLGDGPVPPVVRIKSAAARSQRSSSACRTESTPSGTRRRSDTHSVAMTRLSHSSIAGPPRSSYSPWLARSETVNIPMRTMLNPRVPTCAGRCH